MKKIVPLIIVLLFISTGTILFYGRTMDLKIFVKSNNKNYSIEYDKEKLEILDKIK